MTYLEFLSYSPVVQSDSLKVPLQRIIAWIIKSKPFCHATSIHLCIYICINHSFQENKKMWPIIYINLNKLVMKDIAEYRLNIIFFYGQQR